MKLHQLMESSARKNPDAVALHFGNHSLTYGQLDLYSQRLAVQLQRLGVGPHHRVAIWSEKSPWVVVAMQAILKLGAAYVPLDPMCPLERARVILSDCAVHAIVTTQNRGSSLHGDLAQLPRILLDQFRPESPGEKGSDGIPSIMNQDFGRAEFTEVSENSPAYILYTSGSTGTPKGVCISHRNALAFVEWAASTLNVSPEDRFSNHAPFHFDLTVLDLYVPFLKGASVVLIPELLAYAPKKLAEFIRTKKINHWYSVPSVLILMMDKGGLLEQHLSSLKTLIFAGEVFPIQQLKRLREFLPQARFLNLYGPTETNVCTFYEVGEIPESQVTPLPIGKVCCGNEGWIAREDGTRVESAHEQGELVIRGPTVMMGYWGKAPVKDSTYATGDIVSLAEDGNYIFIGRKDHQVKVRGYRISLLEVEAVLVTSPDVKEAVVFVLGAGLEARLFACVVAHDGRIPSLLEIKKHCSKYLPPYMNVEGFELFSEFPRTSTGKTDRKALFAELERKMAHVPFRNSA